MSFLSMLRKLRDPAASPINPRFKAGDIVYSTADSRPLRIARTYIMRPRIEYDFYSHGPTRLPERMLSKEASCRATEPQNYWDGGASWGFSQSHRGQACIFRGDRVIELTAYDAWRLASMLMSVVEDSRNFAPPDVDRSRERVMDPSVDRVISCPGWWPDNPGDPATGRYVERSAP